MEKEGKLEKRNEENKGKGHLNPKIVPHERCHTALMVAPMTIQKLSEFSCG